jgi:broad specificity phosphatase PhoE
MTKLILTRHGHVEGISPERFRGRAELPLTELGRREAEMTAARIAASWRPAAIYTSPMGRCVDTGAAIARPLGLAPSAILRLNDIDYGDWQGLTRDEAHARWPAELDLWYSHPDWAAIPNGESLQQVLTRAVAALRDIVRRHPDDTVVLVSHDSVNRVLLLHALELPLSRYWRLRQSPCCINPRHQSDRPSARGELTWRAVPAAGIAIARCAAR